MRQNKFKANDIVKGLLIVEKDKIVITPNGTKKTYWKCKCMKCGEFTSKSTQTIQEWKGCKKERTTERNKPRNSGRKTPPGTNVFVNCLIGIYKSNARKRNIDFNLEYKDFERLVTSECYYCGDKNTNKITKKGYGEFYYNGIDRVDNNYGYENGNCVPCCEFCNKAKRNVAKDEFYAKCLKIAERIKTQRTF